MPREKLDQIYIGAASHAKAGRRVPVSIQLAGIDQAPRSVPGWPQLMADLCHPPAHRVARVLGVSLRTVRRYEATGRAPRAACLALFWLTTWGRESVHAQATNDAQLAVACLRSLNDEVRRLEARIEHLHRIGHFGAANDPGQHPPRPTQPVAMLKGKP